MSGIYRSDGIPTASTVVVLGFVVPTVLVLGMLVLAVVLGTDLGTVLLVPTILVPVIIWFDLGPERLSDTGGGSTTLAVVEPDMNMFADWRGGHRRDNAVRSRAIVPRSWLDPPYRTATYLLTIGLGWLVHFLVL